MINLGYFGYSNPDKPAWYSVGPQGQQQLYASEAEANEAIESMRGKYEVVDIHQRFVTWFLWGFCVLIAPIVSIIPIWISNKINSTLGFICAGSLGCSIACAGLAWWISGQIWRFRSDGSFACGDIPIEKLATEEEWRKEVLADDSLFQYRSGYFMRFFYIICWIMIALNILCSVVWSVYFCATFKNF